MADQKIMDAKEAYLQIEEWCAEHEGTGSAIGLMRLVASLYNGSTWSYSIPVCIRALDKKREEWAKAIILDYFERDENEELATLGGKFASMVKEFHWPPDNVPEDNGIEE